MISRAYLQRGRPFLCILFWTISILIFLKTFSIRLFDPDLWWHLAAGREMVENGRFLRTDIFSHTLYGVGWINFEWLSQMAMYLLFKGGGLIGLYSAKMILCLAVLGLVGWLAWTAGARQEGLLLSVWSGFLVLRFRLFERAELMTLLFLPLLILLLLSLRKKSLPFPARYIPFVVFGLMVIWCNGHGGFVYGLGILVLFNMGARWAKEDPTFIRILDRSFVYALIGILINPYGPRLSAVFVEHFFQFSPSDQILVQEWLPGEIKNVPYFWALFFLCAAGFVWGFRRHAALTQFWAPAVLVFQVWGSFYFRTSVLLAFVGIPFLIELAQRRSMTGWFKAGLLACLLVIALHFRILLSPFPQSLVAWNRFPVKATEFVNRTHIEGKMYNAYGQGGYIEWVTGPERKVFMDGRYLFHPFLVDTGDLNQGRSVDQVKENWKRYFSQYHVNYAIMDYPSSTFDVHSGDEKIPLTALNLMFPRSDWALVFWDDAGLVFLKRDAAHKKNIQAHEYKTIWPYSLDHLRHMLVMSQVSSEELDKELSRHEKEVGPTVIGGEIRKMIQPFLSKDELHVG